MRKCKAIINRKQFRILPDGEYKISVSITAFRTLKSFNAKWNEIVNQCLPSQKNDGYSCTISHNLITSTVDSKHYYSIHSYEAVDIDLA